MGKKSCPIIVSITQRVRLMRKHIRKFIRVVRKLKFYMVCLKSAKKITLLRPIISAVGSYTHSLAKYLVEILTPEFNDHQFMLRDTFDFVNKVFEEELATNVHLISFDIESLFTNIPTGETIEIILNKIFTQPEPDKEKTGKPGRPTNPDRSLFQKFNGLTRSEFKQLLTKCTKSSHFIFNDKYYDQIDGLAMGSPLRPLFANIFMDSFEKKTVPNLKELGVKFWLRYVDDTFVVIEDYNNIKSNIDLLNSQHTNIKFTSEEEPNNRLAF